MKMRKALAAIAITAISFSILASAAWACAKFKVLHVFTGGADGAYPSNVPALIMDQAGNLYGTARGGGNFLCSDAGGCGLVFKLTPNQNGGWSETVLYSFLGGDDGSNPETGVIFDSAGNLYGTTFYGGPDDAGTVFQLTSSPDGTWTERVLHSFNGTDGNQPFSSLIFDKSGDLYGTTFRGGTYGCGTVFELVPNGGGNWTEKVLHNFTCGADGSLPHGSLIFDALGNLYGTTRNGGKSGLSCAEDFGTPGCGLVFQLMPNSDGTWTEKVLHSFTGGKDGANPGGVRIIFDAAGNLYGTTSYGGAYGGGNVFELTANADGTWTEKVLHQFTGGTDGNLPVVGLISDSSGNLYGTTWTGGTDKAGVAFELTLASDGKWRENVLHSFAGKSDGVIPQAGLVFDAKGTLYGASRGWSDPWFGSVYEISPSFAIGATPQSASVSPGQSTTSTLTITPLVNFHATVNLSCTVPSGKGLSCGPSPSTVTLDGKNPVTLTLSVETSSTTPAGTYKIRPTGNPGPAGEIMPFTLTVQ